ncbi:MAG: hypothetical protein QXN55_01100 [Candidatus Nitrosotenuis sp.]
MPSFKDFASVKIRDAAPWMYAEYSDVIDWVHRAISRTQHIKVSNDLIISSSDDVEINDNVITALPVRLDTSRKLTLNTANLRTLRGVPESSIFGALIIASNELEELDYLPSAMASLNIMDCPKITSLHNIHTKIKSMKLIFVNKEISNSILGLVLIKDISNILSNSADKDSKLNKARRILNDCFLRKKDLLECKAELIENGLSEYAKL